jgi:hypothetical protein
MRSWYSAANANIVCFVWPIIQPQQRLSPKKWREIDFVGAFT